MTNSLGPVVTVVMPIHGKPTWLRQALESILNQSFVDWEFIGFIDGVNPRAKEILDSFGARFVYLSSDENIGAAAARNACILRANGKYIATLDSDDYWPADHLQAQVKVLEESREIVFVGCSAHMIDGYGKLLSKEIVAPETDLRRKLIKRNVFVNSSVVFRRDAVMQVGLYRPGLRWVEDYHLWLRLALLGEVSNNSNRMVYYRVHPQQSSAGTPTWSAIKAVGHARYEAARSLNVSVLNARVWHWLWVAWQWTRPARRRLRPAIKGMIAPSR
jgi:glycosyltransferase involved in cell wall biosynthesis